MSDLSKRKLNNSRNPSPNQYKQTLTPTNIRLTNQKQLGGTIVRKPKKVIKGLKIQTQPQLQDKALVNEELKVWIHKFHSSKNVKNPNDLKQTLVEISEHNKQAINTAYELIRKDEKLAQCLPLTNRPLEKMNKDRLTINLEEVSNLRSKSQKRKVQIDQVYFETNFQSKSSRSLGFRPIASRCPERLIWNKKAFVFKSLKKSNIEQLLHKKEKKTLSLHKEKQTNELKSTITHQKSEMSIFESPRRIGNYTSRSRQRKCWQTIGFQQWINKPITKDINQFRS